MKPSCNIARYWRPRSSVLLASALLLATSGSAEQKTEDAPRIQNENGDELLVLPERLSNLIRDQMPGFRVPEPKDRAGNWAQDTDTGNLPYVVWGDFHGSGHTDVALILLGNKEWKLAIFHQTAAGYSIAYTNGRKLGAPDALVESPQALSLKLVPKGKPYAVGNAGAAGKEVRRTFATDAIEFSGVETFLSVLYWKNGKYASLDFSD